MSKSKISLLSIKQINKIVKESDRFSEVLEKIGYKQLQDKRTITKLKEICNANNIDYSHLKGENTRICNICKKEKALEEYYIINGRIMYWCKECQKQKEKNKYQNKVSQIIEYKKILSCKKCGETRFYLLDFHHRDPKEKDYTISNHSRASLETIKNEIKKCDVLCSNCHREWHYLSSHNDSLSYESWLNADVGELV